MIVYVIDTYHRKSGARKVLDKGYRRLQDAYDELQNRGFKADVRDVTLMGNDDYIAKIKEVTIE